MSSANDRHQNRPVSHSHYTKKPRSSAGANSTQISDLTNEQNRSDQGKRKSARQSSHQSRISNYFANHLWAFISTLGSLYRTPLSTLLTTMVVGIALALPAGLFVVLQNVQHLSASWDNGAQISLFLKQGVNQSQATRIIDDLKTHTSIANVQYISSEQALDEFREKSGFDDALTLLEENPLPSVLVVSLINQHPGETEVTAMMSYLGELENVDLAQLDMQWLQRLNGIIHIGQRGIMIVATLLAVAILVIIGNTVRLTIQSRHQEIEVIKLIGGTDGFIQRPFLYGGIWYGMMGGLIAWLLVFSSLLIISGPVKNLSALYHSDFELIGLSARESITIIILGICLGWLGSWLSVRRHLHEIEPS